ncbi:hypothetical protein [Anaerococcus sp. Marseille-P3625]|uniref:hypothetical protein n=1 Tax=Anaerococcus sp. Marseille-P3625 TaxID=1977277 RepID=UPI000C06D092|nr:hypothetical protein [Anaerococcus sp. Marseille-P3625]
MTGIINLISNYSSKLNILPIIVVMNIIVTILIHFLTKKKITKYLPSFVMLIAAIIIFVYALSIFTTSKGLNFSWIAVFLASAGLVGIFVSLIIDLIKSIKNSQEIDEDKSVGKKESSNKKPEKLLANPKRVAKKNRKFKQKNSIESKFVTKKIDTKSINNKIKAYKFKKENHDFNNNKKDK